MSDDWEYSRTADIFVNPHTLEELERPIGVNIEQETTAQMLDGKKRVQVTSHEKRHSGKTRNRVIIVVAVLIGMFFVMQYISPTGFMNPEYAEYDDYVSEWDYDDGDGAESYYYDNETDSFYAEPPPPEDYTPRWLVTSSSYWNIRVNLGSIVRVRSDTGECDLAAYRDIFEYAGTGTPAPRTETRIDINGQPYGIWLQNPRPTKDTNYHHSKSKGIDYYGINDESQDILKTAELIYTFNHYGRTISTSIGVNETPTVLSKVIYLYIAIRKGCWAGNSFQDTRNVGFATLILQSYNYRTDTWTTFYDLLAEWEYNGMGISKKFEGMSIAVDLTNPPASVDCERVSNSFFSIYSDTGYTSDFISSRGGSEFRIKYTIDYELFPEKKTVVPLDGRHSSLKFDGAHFPEQSGTPFGGNNVIDTAALNFFGGWVGMGFDQPKEVRGGIYIHLSSVQTKYDANRV